MTTIKARYIDTCLSSYLVDGCNRPGQSLCHTGLGGSLPDTIEGLMDSMDMDAGIPDTVSNGEIAKALREALEGVDLRYIDEHGIRQSDPGDDERGDEEPYIYVVLEWEACDHDPIWASAACADSCDGIIDITCRNCGASGSTQIEESSIQW